MENLSALGVSATTLDFLEQDELEDVTHNPEEEVPYVARLKGAGNTREPVYDTIPREKWERQEATDDALEQVGAILDGEGETGPSLIFTGAEHSPTEYGVQIRTTPGRRTEIEDLLPTEVPGVAYVDGNPVRETEIPIDVIEAELQLQAGDNDAYGGHLWDNVAGGAPISAPHGTESNYGTITAPFSSDQYGDGWVTAGHIVDVNDNQVFHHVEGNTETLGDSRDYTERDQAGNDQPETDCAFIESMNGKTPISWIAAEDYSDPTDIDIGGIVTDQGLENNVGDGNFLLQVQGRYTGRTSPSQINGVEKTFTGDVKSAIVDQYATQDGDSGGPVFHVDGGIAYIAGSHYGMHDDRPGSIATTAETIEEELGGTFM